MGRKKKYIDEQLIAAAEQCRRIWPPMNDSSAKIHFIGGVEKEVTKYSVYTRYEYWSPEGKKFSAWHKVMFGDFNTMEESKEFIKQCKESSVNKKVHLKEEYKIEENI